MRLLIFIGSFLFVVSSVYSQNNKLETILQKGHSKYVTAADFHPSGKYVVTAGYDHSIILWNLTTGKEIRMFNRHTSAVWSVIFSPEGDQILSTSADQTTKLYDVKTGKLIHSWKMPKDDVRQAYFSQNGSHVILANNRGKHFVYDRVSGAEMGEYAKNYGSAYQKQVINLTGTKILSTSSYKGAEIFDLNTGDTLLHIPFDKVFSMGFSPDGSKVILGSTKLFAKVFDTKTGKELYELKDPDSEARCDGCNTRVVWSNNGKYILTMSRKVDAILWDANNGKKIRAFNDTREHPTVIKFSPNDSHVLISLRSVLYIYETKTGRKTVEIKNDKLPYFDVNFSPDGNYILIPGESSTAELWSVKSGRKKTTLSGYLNHKKDDGLNYSYSNWGDSRILNFISMKRSFALSPDNEHIVIGSIDSVALMINLSSGKVVKEFVGHSKVVLAFDFSPDGKTLATAGGEGNIILWDVASGKEKETVRAHRDLIFEIAFNSEGTELVTASWGGTIGCWNLIDGSFAKKEVGESAPYTVGFTPDDLYVVSGDLDKNFSFWEADILAEYRTLVGNSGVISDFSFSPSGKEVVTSSWDGRVKVWDVLTGMQLGRLTEHNGAVQTVDWHPQNKYIASAGADNAIILWDYKSKKVIKKLIGHNNTVTDLKFTSDGSKLISTSIEGLIKIWDLTEFTETYSRIQISRDQWLTTTPNGYFDGSSKALNLVNYVSGMEVVPVGSLFDKYFSPGLIKRINSGEKFNETGENINELIESSPLIAFHLTESTKRSIPVEEDSIYRWKKDLLPLGIRINSQNQELEEIRVYNNGKLIISESLDDKIVFRGGDKDVKNYEVPLSDGENLITALVINKDRTESSPTEILVQYDGEAAETDLYILSVGINTYKNPKYNLEYAVNDSKSFTKSLKNGGGALFHEIFEFSITNDKATKEFISATIEQIKKEIGPEDVFVFYYAGHGVMSYEKKQEDSDFYIVTHDVTNLYGEVEMLKEIAISAKQLMQYSMEIAAEKQLFILDACHSGGALESFSTRGDGREKALAQLARSTGTFFLTASQDVQYANEVGNLKHGLFTYALLEILGGEVGGNGDNKITINEVKSYVEDRVPDLSEKYHGSPQYPTSYSFGQDFPLVILK